MKELAAPFPMRFYYTVIQNGNIVVAKKRKTTLTTFDVFWPPQQSKLETEVDDSDAIHEPEQ